MALTLPGRPTGIKLLAREMFRGREGGLAVEDTENAVVSACGGTGGNIAVDWSPGMLEGGVLYSADVKV
jgi:hypothetical protein